MKKKFAIAIAVIFMLIAGTFSFSRYGWKLFGFQFCSPPSMVSIRNITIDKNENLIKLSGHTFASAPAFVGFIYKIEDETLYVGMKYNLLFGFLNRDGSFNIRMSAMSNDFNRIVLKNKDSERVIWEKGGPKVE